MLYSYGDNVEFLFKGNIKQGTIVGGSDGYYKVAFNYNNEQDAYSPPEYSIYTIDSHSILNKIE